MSSLPFDVCRCLGRDCRERSDCLRFTDRDKVGLSTPFVYSMRPAESTGGESCSGKIEAIREPAK